MNELSQQSLRMFFLKLLLTWSKYFPSTILSANLSILYRNIPVSLWISSHFVVNKLTKLGDVGPSPIRFFNLCMMFSWLYDNFVRVWKLFLGRLGFSFRNNPIKRKFQNKTILLWQWVIVFCLFWWFSISNQVNQCHCHLSINVPFFINIFGMTSGLLCHFVTQRKGFT